MMRNRLLTPIEFGFLFILGLFAIALLYGYWISKSDRREMASRNQGTLKEDRSVSRARRNFYLKYAALFAGAIYIPGGIILFTLRFNNAIPQTELGLGTFTLITLSIIAHVLITRWSERRFPRIHC